MSGMLKHFEENKYIAVIRSSTADDAEEMIKAAMDGGFRLFEISVQTSQFARLLEAYSKKPNCFFGASAVTDGEIAQRAINAGAQFISSPFTDREVIAVAKHNDTAVIQGALTPTEAMNAYQLGADLVKVYPVGLAGQLDYLKTLKSTLPFIKLIAAGGITLESASAYLKDCAAVAIGKALFDRSLLRKDNWTEIAERARQLTQIAETVKVPK